MAGILPIRQDNLSEINLEGILNVDYNKDLTPSLINLSGIF